ncbi:unnamed protein product [Danaus chrysippus]|uniref:(African queen) hypothetical protein n=1 Tax=Danaus chrysippus TaxID=151541 RepID=A0A8J2W3Z9_9NEOP|nr:unnamed protein product [Danaus chrysippus]
MLKIIIFVGLVTGAPTNIDYGPINQFTLKLLDNAFTYQDSIGKRNVAISPLSIWSIFSLLAEGSTGETFNELMKELRLPNDLRLTQALHSGLASLMKSKDSDVVLNGKTAMFADSDIKVHQEFCESALYYGADVYSVDPSNTTKLADDINYYICIATEGKIREAVRPELLESLKLVLVDALYFKASWTHPFDRTQTKVEDFYNYQGKTIGSVNMMYHKAPHNFGDANSIEAQVLEMNYGKNEKFSMLILLPFDGTSIKKVLENLVTQPLDWTTEYRITDEFPEIDCYIPRFKISSQIDLIRPMQYSGVTSIFDPEKAELPGVSDSPLYVSKTIQTVEIEVNEEGTVAAASTVVGLEDRILGARFEANKEFAYLITERDSGLILLAGVYTEPTVV